jgi:hypothetical protein
MPIIAERHKPSFGEHVPDVAGDGAPDPGRHKPFPYKEYQDDDRYRAGHERKVEHAGKPHERKDRKG